MVATNQRPEAGRFRVLATCAGFEPGFRHGGPVRSMAGIVDSVSDEIDLRLVTHDRDAGCREPYPGLSGRWVKRGRSRVFYLNTHSPSQWLRLGRDLQQVPFDVLYVNSVWAPVFTFIPVVAAKVGLIRTRRILIAPRGELSLGALSMKSKKKRLFMKWWSPFLKTMQVRWHASTSLEAEEIRAVIPWARVEVNQNPVMLPLEPLSPSADSQVNARFVFIGRISPKKNIHLTLQALKRVSTPIAFDIYGPVSDSAYWAKCALLIEQLPPHISVTYEGELLASEVRRTFANYDAFIFPTLGENFGHVIAESLSASCPVICSGETPWTVVLEMGGGAVVRELTAARLGDELQHFAAMKREERMAARHGAGAAYRLWRAKYEHLNILDHARLSWESSSGTGRATHLSAPEE
jgi:glycosyltransferase involved in cell wall biosynthesis